MKTEIAATLVGLLALANAYGGAPSRSLKSIPVPKNYQERLAAISAPAVVSSPEPYEEEPVVVVREEPEKVVYKAPQRILEKQPIRVAYNKERVEEEPQPHYRHGSGGHGSYDNHRGRTREEQEEIEQEYIRNAQYQFASAVDDGIMDNSQIRQETRNGAKVTGSYAYSDGYFKRTVNYEADENGYRVVGETVEPISESGPIIDLVNGRAEVHTQIAGVDTSYSVDAEELAHHRRKHAKLEDVEAEYSSSGTGRVVPLKKEPAY